MPEIVFRFDPDDSSAIARPATASEARQRLEDGNRAFARVLAGGDTSESRSHVIPVDPRQLGYGTSEETYPEQTPFAAVLACADARAPTELIFSQAGNDLFVTRVAGNVLAGECLGSLEYAAEQLESIRLFVVLGHSGCGAVTAAVDAFLDPARYPMIATTPSLRSIVGSLALSVRGAAKALRDARGADVSENRRYRRALIETSVATHAALTAWMLQRELQPTTAAQRSEVVYGVYDLATRHVRLPLTTDSEADTGLAAPPTDSGELEQRALEIASGAAIGEILGA